MKNKICDFNVFKSSRVGMILISLPTSKVSTGQDPVEGIPIREIERPPFCIIAF